MRAALVDLVTGSACAGCGDPGRLLCRPCADSLHGRARVAWPTPCPSGLALPVAAGDYADLLRTLVLGHKEERQLALGRPLGTLLADTVQLLLREVEAPAAPVVLVPVPSRSRATRARGHDPTYTLVREAARALRGRGYDAAPHRLLGLGRVLDQAGLDAGARQTNLAGSMSCPSAGLARLARRCPRAVLVVCDDVLTTGATAREAQRALTASGVAPCGIATVAATRRRVRGSPQPVSLVLSPSTD